MIIVDSSFLIAFFNPSDTQHQNAIQDMKRYDNNKEEFLITEHVLSEIATVLLYKNGLEAATIFLDFAQEKCKLQIWDKGDRLATLEYFKDQKYELSYIDASIIYLAKFLGLSVACYDHNILKELNI